MVAADLWLANWRTRLPGAGESDDLFKGPFPFATPSVLEALSLLTWVCFAGAALMKLFQGLFFTFSPSLLGAHSLPLPVDLIALTSSLTATCYGPATCAPGRALSFNDSPPALALASLAPAFPRLPHLPFLYTPLRPRFSSFRKAFTARRGIAYRHLSRLSSTSPPFLAVSSSTRSSPALHAILTPKLIWKAGLNLPHSLSLNRGKSTPFLSPPSLNLHNLHGYQRTALDAHTEFYNPLLLFLALPLLLSSSPLAHHLPMFFTFPSPTFVGPPGLTYFGRFIFLVISAD